MYQTSGLWTDFPLGPMTSTQTKLSPALTPTLLLAPRWIYRPPHSPALTPSSPDQTRPNPHDAPPRANKQDAYQGSQPEEAVAVAAADSTTRCQQTGGMLLSVRLLGSRCHVSNLNHDHGRGRGHVCLFSSLTFSRGSRLVPSVRPSVVPFFVPCIFVNIRERAVSMSRETTYLLLSWLG